MLSDLPKDLAEEVLCKLPVTSLRRVRFTCKRLNTLSRDRNFIRKHIRKAKAKNKEFQVVMMLDYKVSLFSVNLLKLKPSIESVAKLISLDDADRIDISNISYCDGLLLCLTKDLSSLVVWNPCSGQTRWIQPRISFTIFDRYALGYHKVLRFVDDYDITRTHWIRRFEIYNLHSNFWKVLDVKPDWNILHFRHGVSLNGNTYWYAREKMKISVAGERGRDVSYLPDFLLCFDFTTERFGPRLPLPFRALVGDTVILSSVRGTELAVLFQTSCKLKIWISSQIEPDSVSWNKLFLKVDMQPLTGFQFYNFSVSFFLHEKKKMAVVLDKDRDTGSGNYIAYIIGKNGYFKKVDLGKSTHPRCWPLACPYVPTSLQIKQAGNQNLP